MTGSEASMRRRKLSFGKSSDVKTMVRGKTPTHEILFNQAV
jgi:hypothetical protein